MEKLQLSTAERLEIYEAAYKEYSLNDRVRGMCSMINEELQSKFPFWYEENAMGKELSEYLPDLFPEFAAIKPANVDFDEYWFGVVGTSYCFGRAGVRLASVYSKYCMREQMFQTIITRTKYKLKKELENGTDKEEN